MKESGKDRLKQAIYEHPSTAARSHFPNGVGKEEGASPPQKEANPALLRSAVHLSTKIGHETKKIRHKN